jgi:hypothetical protein
VDSLHVYQALEEIVNSRPELAVFRDTGMERTNALEKDIEFMVQEYGLERPEPGCPGGQYAKLLREIESTPELVCHYYFAHTAGGRMIGKQMSALLLDKLTLEFYKVRYVSSDTYRWWCGGHGGGHSAGGDGVVRVRGLCSIKNTAP